MAYTLKGRLETRVGVSLLPILAAAALALWLHAWWPLELAGLMLGVGLALDVLVYHRLLPYQPGWLAAPLALGELAAIIGLALVLSVDPPLDAALGFFAGSWLLAQVLGHAVFPFRRLSYGEDGGELGRAGPAAAAAAAAVLASAGGVAWATEPPTMTLPAGMHEGPLVLDREQTLEGEPGAVVRGGIVVTADGVTVRDVSVVGGENGIEVDGAQRVVLERVRVSGTSLDGINVRRGSVTIRDCLIQSAGEYGQGIDISFGFDLEPSLVEGCVVHGGQEGIVTHFARARVTGNRVSGTSLRGITLTEMSMAEVEDNEVEGALGVGIFCGDYSVCAIEENSVAGTRPDLASGNRTRLGYGIVVHFGADATLANNELRGNAKRVGSFLRARISTE